MDLIKMFLSKFSMAAINTQTVVFGRSLSHSQTVLLVRFLVAKRSMVAIKVEQKKQTGKAQ
jgi:predicted Kef-type K+ transport protein